MLVGAYGNDRGADYSGAVYVLRGPVTGTFSLNESHAVLTGAQENLYVGWSLAGAGDVDADGYDDVLVGAYGESTNGSLAGAVYLVPGPFDAGEQAVSEKARLTLFGEQAGDSAGTATASAGDVNGNGIGDLLIGAPYNDQVDTDAGSVYLIMDASSEGVIDLADADTIFTGSNTYDQLGSAAVGVGDHTGDGSDDILIAAPGSDTTGSNAGSVYLITLPGEGVISIDTAEAVFVGEDSEDSAGFSIASASDLDHNGYTDLLIGAPYHDGDDADTGAAYVIFGPSANGTTNLSSSLASYRGDIAADYAGCSVSSAGDVDGDAYTDILIGASQSDYGGVGAGSAHVFLGTGL